MNGVAQKKKTNERGYMGIVFGVELVENISQDYVMFDRADIKGEEVYVIDKNGCIAKIDTKIRFKVPLMEFGNKFISMMNQIMVDRYESGTTFKMVVDQNGRVGFFCIIHIE